MSTNRWHNSSTFERARRNGEPYVYQHARSGAVLDRRTLLAILGGSYTDGRTVHAPDFRVIDTAGENPFQ